MACVTLICTSFPAYLLYLDNVADLLCVLLSHSVFNSDVSEGGGETIKLGADVLSGPRHEGYILPVDALMVVGEGSLQR